MGNMSGKNKIVFSLGSIFLLFFVFGIGFIFGQQKSISYANMIDVLNIDKKVDSNADFNPFWKVWSVLNEKSILVNDINDQEKIWGAIEGLTASINDPYTVFFPPEENKLFQEEIHGSFSGIGAEISKKDGILTIVAPLKGTPADISGLKSADKILMINEEETSDMTIDHAINKIRGPKGTEVMLTILREGDNKTHQISIKRENIDIPTIQTEIINDVFVISLFSFSENSSNLFREAMNEYKESGLHKMIIDLRGNPGGYLDSAIEITGWFVGAGKLVAIQDFGENKKPINYRSRGPKLFDDNDNLIILIDKGSASASEIMAGALQEYGVAKLVGTQTFGKGSVQELVQITDNTSLKVTIGYWLTPKGRSISASGLNPDHKIEVTLEDLKNDVDLQMEKALNLLK